MAAAVESWTGGVCRCRPTVRRGAVLCCRHPHRCGVQSYLEEVVPRGLHHCTCRPALSAGASHGRRGEDSHWRDDLQQDDCQRPCRHLQETLRGALPHPADGAHRRIQCRRRDIHAGKQLQLLQLPEGGGLEEALEACTRDGGGHQHALQPLCKKNGRRYALRTACHRQTLYQSQQAVPLQDFQGRPAVASLHLSRLQMGRQLDVAERLSAL